MPQENDSLCGHTSVKGTLIIHHFRSNKRGYTAEVTFRASIQQKVIDSSCGKPRWTSLGP